MWFKLLILVTLTIVIDSVTAKNGKVVVCYYNNWAVYRHNHGKYDVENIDPDLCTHLVYSFAGLNEDGSIEILDFWNNINKRGFARFNDLKKNNTNVKTLLTIGGRSKDSMRYSHVVSIKKLRTTFINNAIEFVKTHGFDGIDLDWKYPSQTGGELADKYNFAQLLKEMRTAFDKHKLLLTAAVGATASTIRQSYDVSALSKYLDYIYVMTYNLHGFEDGRTGQNAPLYASPLDTTEVSKQLNVAACIKAWIDNGARPEKLILGIGTYGRSFTLDNESQNGLGAPTSQPGLPGPYTQDGGILGYNEICEKQQQYSWKVIWDDDQKVPYAVRGDQWVGYDNLESVSEKVAFAKEHKLGGVTIRSIDTDDFQGICGRKYPLLFRINALL